MLNNQISNQKLEARIAQIRANAKKSEEDKIAKAIKYEEDRIASKSKSAWVFDETSLTLNYQVVDKIDDENFRVKIDVVKDDVVEGLNVTTTTVAMVTCISGELPEKVKLPSFPKGANKGLYNYFAKFGYAAEDGYMIFKAKAE
jgi:hypothetical protein